MSAPARRVDHAKPCFADCAAVGVYHCRSIEPKVVEGRIERSIKNELFDKLWCLQKCIFLTSSFAQILIEIAEKSSVPICVSKVVDQQAIIGINLLKEP